MQVAENLREFLHIRITSTVAKIGEDSMLLYSCVLLRRSGRWLFTNLATSHFRSRMPRRPPESSPLRHVRISLDYFYLQLTNAPYLASLLPRRQSHWWSKKWSISYFSFALPKLVAQIKGTLTKEWEGDQETH